MSKDNWNAYTQRGNLDDRYNIYLASADDGNGRDSATGEWLKTFDEWLDS